MTLDLPKWPCVNLLTHPQVISSTCVKNFWCFSIKMNRNWHKFYNFPASYLDLDQMKLGQYHDTSSGHKQYLCYVRTSNVSPKIIYGPDMNLQRQTDKRTDGRTNRRIWWSLLTHMLLHTFICGGYTHMEVCLGEKWSFIFLKIRRRGFHY